MEIGTTKSRWVIAAVAVFGIAAPTIAAGGTTVRTEVTETRVVPRGTVTVIDEGARTFRLDESEKVYVLPERESMETLDGAQVTIELDENGDVKRVVRVEKRTLVD